MMKQEGRCALTGLKMLLDDEAGFKVTAIPKHHNAALDNEPDKEFKSRDKMESLP